MTLNYRPLRYMWIAEFSDGSALPQFDPETGKENKADPDWLPSAPGQPKIPKDRVYREKKLVKFGWYPFTSELAKKIFEAEAIIVIPTDNPRYFIELNDGDKLLAYRTNTINFSLQGGISRGETVYVLGKTGGKLLHIHEDGSVE